MAEVIVKTVFSGWDCPEDVVAVFASPEAFMADEPSVAWERDGGQYVDPSGKSGATGHVVPLYEH